MSDSYSSSRSYSDLSPELLCNKQAVRDTKFVWCYCTKQNAILTTGPGRPLSPGKPLGPGGPSLPAGPEGPGSPCKSKHNVVHPVLL